MTDKDDKPEPANDPGQPDTTPPTISAFVETHCMTCTAGWTRRGQGGGVVVVCLLDRERVWPEMLECDRYESRDAAPDES